MALLAPKDKKSKGSAGYSLRVTRICQKFLGSHLDCCCVAEKGQHLDSPFFPETEPEAKEYT